MAVTPGPVDGPLAVVPWALRRLVRLVLALDAATVDLVLALRSPLLTKLMTSVTGLGSASAAAVLLGLCYLAGWRRETRVAAPALLLSGAVVAALMALVGRPFPPQPVCVTSGAGLAPHSFPSGHAAAVTVFALVARRSDDLPAVPVAVVAGLVAVSRIYLGTHFLSDTVVGVGVGAGAVLLVRALLARRAGAWPATPTRAVPDD
jgi:membrane-associated phospholipid phosphatase